MNQTSLRQFAEQNRLRTRRDEDNTLVAVGRLAKSRPGVRRISDYEDGRLLLSIHNSVDSDAEYRLSKRGWTYVKKRCLGAGMTLHQNGDREGSFLFDPAVPEQAAQAIEESGAQKRRVEMTDARWNALAQAQPTRPHTSS